jgi:hypothetical protein
MRYFSLAIILVLLLPFTARTQSTMFQADFQNSAVQSNTTTANLNVGTVVGSWSLQITTNLNVYGDAGGVQKALCPDSNGNGGYGLTAKFANSALLASNVTVTVKLACGRNGTSGTGKAFSMVGYDVLGNASFDLQVFANQDQAGGTNGAIYWNNGGVYANWFGTNYSRAGDVRQLAVSSTGYNPASMTAIKIQLSASGYVVSLDKNNDGTIEWTSGVLPYNTNNTHHTPVTTISQILFAGGSGSGDWFDDLTVTGVAGAAPVGTITNGFVTVSPESQTQLITDWGYDIKGVSGNTVTPDYARTLFVTDHMSLLRVPIWGNIGNPAHPSAGVVVGSYYADQLYAMTNARAANSNVLFFASKKLDGTNSFPVWTKDSNGIIPSQYAVMLADYLQYIYTNGGFAIDVLGVDNESTYNEGNISASDFNSIINQLRSLAASRGFPLPKRFIGPENYGPDTSWLSTLMNNGWGTNLDIVGTHYYPQWRPLSSLQSLVALDGYTRPDWHSEVHWDNIYTNDIDNGEAALATLFDCTDTGLSGYVWWGYTRSGVVGGIESAFTSGTAKSRPVATTDLNGSASTLGTLIARSYRNGTNLIVWVLNNTTNAYANCKINVNRGSVTGSATCTSWTLTGVTGGTTNAASSTNFLVTLGARNITQITFAYAPPGPDALYALDGNVLDTSGSGNDGTAFNTTNYLLGRVGPLCLSFNGSNSYVQIPRVIGGQQDFTIAFWLRTTSPGGSGSQWWSGSGLVDGEVSGTTNDFGVSLLNGKIAFGVGNPDTTVASTITVTNGQWHHVAVTRNSFTGEMGLYLDGVLNTNIIGPTGLRTAPPGLRLGSVQTGAAGKFFIGSLDDVRLYNGLLATNSIYALAATPPHSTPVISRLVKAGGMAQISLTGDTNVNYTVLGSSNLIYWSALLVTNPLAMPLTVQIPVSNYAPAQFYRLQIGP